MDLVIELNPRASMSTKIIGDGQKAIVVDDFLSDPHAVVEYAAAKRASLIIIPHNLQTSSP